jgi:hypothetical protein
VIVFMTDGIPENGVTDTAQIAQLFRERNRGRARLFAFGVGSDVNRTFFEQLGSENRGGYGFVEGTQDIDAARPGTASPPSPPRPPICQLTSAVGGGQKACRGGLGGALYNRGLACC